MKAGRPALRVVSLLAALVAFAASGGPVAADGAGKKGPPAASPPGWSVRCDSGGKGRTCSAVHTLMLAGTRQLLLSVSVSRPPGSTGAAIFLQLPHGLFNPAGATIAADAGKPMTLAIQTCDMKGCYAGASLTGRELASLRTGRTLKVVFQDLKRQNITVHIPLAGFDAAYGKL